MSQALHALMEQAARVRVYDGQRMSVRAEGVVIGYCDAPMLIIRRDDGTLVHESSQLPREVVPVEEPRASSCSQCGQRTPICAEENCGESIIFVPKAGFGNRGEWRHLAPPKVHHRPHMARPKVFVS